MLTKLKARNLTDVYIEWYDEIRQGVDWRWVMKMETPSLQVLGISEFMETSIKRADWKEGSRTSPPGNMEISLLGSATEIMID